MNMDYRLQINHLKKEMLIYELTIRGIPVDDSKTVDELRSALRPLLKLEKQGKSIKEQAYNFNIDEELDYISAAVKDISTSIKTTSKEPTTTKFERNQSRLIHLLRRVDRIPTEGLSEDKVQLRAGLFVNILSDLDELEKQLSADPNLSAMLDSTHLQGDGKEPTRSPTPLPTDTQHQPPTDHLLNTVTCPVTTPVVPVQKWGLQFTGDPKHMSVHAFLERVEELRSARHISEKDLFDSAIDLFSGKALNWFRAYRTRFSNWRELADLLCQHYEPPDYRTRLFREILDRTQDTSEGIVDYLSSMSALFRRYGSFSEEAQLDIIIKNLSPFYTTQLPVVHSIEELESECLKLEAKKYRADHYVPPPRRRLNLVEPDFAYIGASEPCNSGPSINSCEDSLSKAITGPLPNASAIADQHNRSKANVICWNCQGQGHLSRNCPKPRKLRCFKCGQLGVTIRNCPKCNASENARRGNQN